MTIPTRDVSQHGLRFFGFIKICQNTPQLCWGDEWPPSPLGGEG